VVKITGDCSDYNGNFRIGKDSNDLGRNTRFYPPEGGIAGSLTVKATGCVALGSKDVTVGEISFEDGSTFITGKGCLNVTNAFADLLYICILPQSYKQIWGTLTSRLPAEYHIPEEVLSLHDRKS